MRGILRTVPKVCRRQPIFNRYLLGGLWILHRHKRLGFAIHSNRKTQFDKAACPMHSAMRVHDIGVSDPIRSHKIHSLNLKRILDLAPLRHCGRLSAQQGNQHTQTLSPGSLHAKLYSAAVNPNRLQV
jgi:hypothetical protein